MQVRMMHQGGSPGMEDGEEADLSAEMFGVGGDGPERLRHRLKEDPVNDPFVLKGDGGDLVRDGEHDVEIVDGQEFSFAALDPRRAGQGLTRRTMSIAAAVVPHARVSAAVALFDMPTEGGGPAPLNGAHDAPLRGQE